MRRYVSKHQYAEAWIFVIRGCMFLLSLVATYQLWRVPLKAGLSTYKELEAAQIDAHFQRVTGERMP